MHRKYRIKKRIIYIIGTRPEIIRSAFIITALKSDSEVLFRLVHTGQHYDYLMNDAFFRELCLPLPDINFGVGSGTHAEQTSEIMLKFEKYLMEFKADLVAVFGDTNSSLAATLAAVKLQIPVAHIEAGCREWEMNMPEEINRRLIDHCSRLLLAVSETCVQNLYLENVLGEVYNTGDPLFDVFKKYFQESLKLKLSHKLGTEDKDYILLTLHRSNNVDNLENLRNIISAFEYFKDISVVFPAHPRTKYQLEKIGYNNFKQINLIIIEPLQYQEILNLIYGAKIVITDSGGLQKEAFWAKVPCITLRDHTSWIETIDFGVNYLSGIKKEKIIETICYIDKNYERIKKSFDNILNPYAKNNTIIEIVKLLKKFADKKW